ncbi:MAG: restriction endonuclease subunit S [Pseudomonadota bacterium]
MSDETYFPEPPKGWVWTTVGELYDIVGGGTPSTNVAEYWDGNIPWITSADIYGLKDIRPRKQITKKAIENSATNLVPEGSLIVVTRVGLGKIALTKTPICFSQDSQALVGCNSLPLPDYSLYYLSNAVQIFKYVHRGTTIAGVTSSNHYSAHRITVGSALDGLAMENEKLSISKLN